MGMAGSPKAKAQRRRHQGPSERRSRAKKPQLMRRDQQKTRSVFLRKRRDSMIAEDNDGNSGECVTFSVADTWVVVDESAESVTRARTLLQEYLQWARSLISSWLGK